MEKIQNWKFYKCNLKFSFFFMNMNEEINLKIDFPTDFVQLIECLSDMLKDFRNRKFETILRLSIENCALNET